MNIINDTTTIHEIAEEWERLCLAWKEYLGQHFSPFVNSKAAARKRSWIR